MEDCALPGVRARLGGLARVFKLDMMAHFNMMHVKNTYAIGAHSVGLVSWRKVAPHVIHVSHVRQTT